MPSGACARLESESERSAPPTSVAVQEQCMASERANFMPRARALAALAVGGSRYPLTSGLRALPSRWGHPRAAAEEAAPGEVDGALSRASSGPRLRYRMVHTPA